MGLTPSIQINVAIKDPTLKDDIIKQNMRRKHVDEMIREFHRKHFKQDRTYTMDKIMDQCSFVKKLPVCDMLEDYIKTGIPYRNYLFRGHDDIGPCYINYTLEMNGNISLCKMIKRR